MERQRGEPRTLRVVVASPGDVQKERDLLPGVFEELNGGVAYMCGVRLELHRWETDAYPGFHAEGPQGLIDRILKIDDSDVVIGIFWKRLGTPTPSGETGTEHELNLALQAWKNNKRPEVMVYFDQKAYSLKSKEETDQWGRVLEFHKAVPKEGLSWPYRGPRQFETFVRNHLTNFILQAHEQAQLDAAEREHAMSSLPPKLPPRLPGEPLSRSQFAEKELQILKELDVGERLLRTRTSVSRMTGIEYPEVKRIMSKLARKSLVGNKMVAIPTGERRRRWFITKAGKRQLSDSEGV